jgi:carbamoyl-phosphate synthase large subunit
MKPRFGIGSKDVKVIASRRALDAELPLAPDTLVFEFVKGPEYTADTISDMSGRCLAAAPRQRIVVKAGQSVKGRTVHDPALVAIAVRAADVFGIEGPGCSQWIVRDGKVIFIEMNPRYGTGVSLSIGAGLNIPLLHVKLGLGLKVDPAELVFRDNCYMSRYWEEVFFDGETFEAIGSGGACP